MSIITTAIDIGSSTIRVVVGEVRDDVIYLIARVEVPSIGIRSGYITNKTESVSAIKKAIRLAEKQIQQKIEYVHVVVSGDPLHTCIQSTTMAVGHGDGMVTDVDIDNSIKRSVKKSLQNNQRNIEHVILSYALDGTATISEPIGMKGKKLEVSAMLFNYASQNMDAYEDVLDQLDVTIVDFFPATIASSIVSLSTIDRKIGCVLIDIGSDTTSCIVYEHDTPVYVGKIPIGSSAITQAIALEYQISVDSAEIIKQGGPLPVNITRHSVDKTISKILTDICRQVNSQLKEVGKSGNLPGGAVLCGGGALLNDVQDIARTVLKIPVRLADIRAYKRGVTDINELVWSNVYGTVIHALEQEKARHQNILTRGMRACWNTVRRYMV